MRLSVIICTYDRYSDAQECVEALRRSKTFDEGTVEIVVVDNTPPSRRKEFTAIAPIARIVPCDVPGLSVARNEGIARSSAELIAFLDDDARPQDGWCRAVLAAFDANPGAMGCGGKTLPIFESETFPPWFYPELSSHLSCIDWGDTMRALQRGEWIVGANMAFRRSAFKEHGLFDPSLGRKGTASLLSNEEISFIEKCGSGNVVYVPDMVAGHRIPVNRIRLDWFRKRVFWQAVSDILSSSVWMSRDEASAALNRATVNAPAEYRGLKLLQYEPRSPDEMKEQLNAIYAYALLMSEGGARAP